MLWEQFGHCQNLSTYSQGKNLEEDEFSNVCDLSGKCHSDNWGKYALRELISVCIVGVFAYVL